MKLRTYKKILIITMVLSLIIPYIKDIVLVNLNKYHTIFYILSSIQYVSTTASMIIFIVVVRKEIEKNNII